MTVKISPAFPYTRASDCCTGASDKQERASASGGATGHHHAKSDVVKLAVNLIEDHSGKFEPQKMPNEYANAVHELVQAKIEQRAPEVEIGTEKREPTKVINIMDALKKSMQARGQTKVREAVSKRNAGKSSSKRHPAPTRPRESSRRAAH